MTVHSFDELLPDSLTGVICAIEGIEDAAVLLNGPTGCKFYHGALVDGQFPRVTSLDPLDYTDAFSFGQPRIPATALDEHDYVFGAMPKLEHILPHVASQGHALIVIVNAPGAALIGDDLERCIAHAGVSVPCIALENPGYSGTFAHGFQSALLAILERLSPPPVPVVEQSVNLVGMTLYQRHWQGNVQELRRLLEQCGIQVVTTLCAGTTVADLRRVRAAQINLVIHDECATQIAAWLEHHLEMPSLVSPMGAPAGFDATEQWLQHVCAAVGVSPDPALETLQAARKQSYAALSRFHALTGLPKGATFALQADPSIAYPLTTWLYHYLGMVPLAVRVTTEASRSTAMLRQFLAEIDCAEAWQTDLSLQVPDVVFGSDALITRLWGQGWLVAGVALALPRGLSFDLVPKPLLGAAGSLLLLEQIINGLSQQPL